MFTEWMFPIPGVARKIPSIEEQIWSRRILQKLVIEDKKHLGVVDCPLGEGVDTDPQLTCDMFCPRIQRIEMWGGLLELLVSAWGWGISPEW